MYIKRKLLYLRKITKFTLSHLIYTFILLSYLLPLCGAKLYFHLLTVTVLYTYTCFQYYNRKT
jgi:hypothetical protein